MWVLHWCLNRRYGHGPPIDDWFTAKAWRDQANKVHGAGTHWLVEV